MVAFKSLLMDNLQVAENCLTWHVQHDIVGQRMTKVNEYMHSELPVHYIQHALIIKVCLFMPVIYKCCCELGLK